MSQSDDTIVVRVWDLEDIERELASASNEATHLAPGPTADLVSACIEAALETLQRILGRE